MKEIRHLKTMKNKRNLNTKWLLLQNDQNADTTLLHSHDEMYYFKMLNDAIVASAGSYVGTCRRIKTPKKIATIRDFHLYVCINPTNFPVFKKYQYKGQEDRMYKFWYPWKEETHSYASILVRHSEYSWGC